MGHDRSVHVPRASMMPGLIPGLQLIEPRRHADARGWFVESYSEAAFAARGITERFVQDNHSCSRDIYTLRGLHLQQAPMAQAKLVRCLRGRMWDVAVDLRPGAVSYGHWSAIELSAENGWQLYIPTGFAHGFLTLAPDCEVAYKVSVPYSAAHEAGILWCDPALNIDWPLPAGIEPVLSSKDEQLPPLAQLMGRP